MQRCLYVVHDPRKGAPLFSFYLSKLIKYLICLVTELDESSTGIDSTDSTTLITIDSYKYPVDLTDKFHEVAAHAHAFAQRQSEAPASDEGYSSGRDPKSVF